MFPDQYLLLFPHLRFTSFFFYICSIFLSPHGVRILAFVFGCTLGDDGSVDMRDEVCNNLIPIGPNGPYRIADPGVIRKHS